LRIKPIILIIAVLLGYAVGVGILFFDNSPTQASFATGFSNFSKITDHNVAQQAFSEPITLQLDREKRSEQIWFFRAYPDFLT